MVWSVEKPRHGQGVHTQGLPFPGDRSLPPGTIREVGPHAVVKDAQGRDAGQDLSSEQGGYGLGRGAACEIVLSDHGVSKRHAKITRKDDGFYIEDLHSTNGTIVGNRDLTETRRLECDELIEIGDTQLVFSETGSTILGVLDVSSTSERHG